MMNRKVNFIQKETTKILDIRKTTHIGIMILCGAAIAIADTTRNRNPPRCDDIIQNKYQTWGSRTQLRAKK